VGARPDRRWPARARSAGLCMHGGRAYPGRTAPGAPPETERCRREWLVRCRSDSRHGMAGDM